MHVIGNDKHDSRFEVENLTDRYYRKRTAVTLYGNTSNRTLYIVTYLDVNKR